jgi:hypothetical protein
LSELGSQTEQGGQGARKVIPYELFISDDVPERDELLSVASEQVWQRTLVLVTCLLLHLRRSRMVGLKRPFVLLVRHALDIL